MADSSGARSPERVGQVLFSSASEQRGEIQNVEQNSAIIRRCAIYTRKSSEEGLEQDFNSLHAQREACEAFIASQSGEGWRLIKTAYDDGGLSGGTMERPALQHLLTDIEEGRVDVIVVYKVDRLTLECGQCENEGPRTFSDGGFRLCRYSLPRE